MDGSNEVLVFALQKKWFVRFLVIKNPESDTRWMDRAKFHGILISRFEKEVVRSIFGYEESSMRYEVLIFCFAEEVICSIFGYEESWMRYALLDRMKF